LLDAAQGLFGKEIGNGNPLPHVQQPPSPPVQFLALFLLLLLLKKMQQKNPNVGAEEDRNSNPVCQMQICEEERLQQIQISTGLHQTMTVIGSHKGCVWG
jgi:hypothetical protein